MPLIFRDCPYQTPLTSFLWFSAQIIPHSYFLVLYHGAKHLPKRWSTVKEGIIKSLYVRQNNKTKSLSENIISKLESTTEPISIETNKKMLARTLSWLHEDHELEEFIAGIPGLYASEAFTTHNLDIRSVIASLPGPTNSRVPLSWSIIWLAQRLSTGHPSNSIERSRTQTCLRALYHIRGAIRDILASYAAGKHYCLEILPLLNSPESLEIIDELWDTPNDDVALSVRCAAAVVAAFMITPPRNTLDLFLTPDICFIGDDDTGKQFLDKRFHVEYDYRSDSTRLQNIVRYLENIKDMVAYRNMQWTRSDNVVLIRRERRALFDMRHTEEYRTGHGTFDLQGNRSSPVFVPAAQQDLITVTVEILARDSVANAACLQREAFHMAYKRFEFVAEEQLRLGQTSGNYPKQLPSNSGRRVMVRAGSQAATALELIKRALEPILPSLLRSDEAPTQVIAGPSLV